jgi:hypothetical protein
MSTESDSEDISEEIADESYHDDPELLVDIPRRNIFAGFAAFLMLLAGTSFYLPATLGASLNLTGVNRLNTDFGFGITKVNTCFTGGSQKLQAMATFVNAPGAGQTLISGLRISLVPPACKGMDIQLKIYDDSSDTPLPIFGNGNSQESYTVATVSYLSTGFFALGSKTTRGATPTAMSTAKRNASCLAASKLSAVASTWT